MHKYLLLCKLANRGDRQTPMPWYINDKADLIIAMDKLDRVDPSHTLKMTYEVFMFNSQGFYSKISK